MTTATDRIKSTTSALIEVIFEGENPSEVKAGAIALASLAGFIVGFAGRRLGDEELLERCREDFAKSAGKSYREQPT